MQMEVEVEGLEPVERVDIVEGPGQAEEDQEEDEDLEDILADWDDEDLYHFIPAPSPPPQSPPQSPSNSPEPPRASSSRATALDLDDNSSDLFEEEYPGAGQVIRMNQDLHQQWRDRFGVGEEDEDAEEAQVDAGSAEDEDRMEVDEEERRGSTKSRRKKKNKKPSLRASAYAPFASSRDWYVAQWVVNEGIGHKSFDRFLEIPGVVESLGLSYTTVEGLHKQVDSLPERAKWKSKYIWFEDKPDDKHLVQYRDPLEAIEALLGNPAHAKHIVYRPRKVFSSQTKEVRVYNEMWTGKWWYSVQSSLEAQGHKGATVAPVIIATDKTQLTQHSGNKAAYPVYLTLGNIPRSIRRKPSQHACVLIGYLSVEKINTSDLQAQEKSARVQRLFHQSMHRILSPLIKAGLHGVEMTCADGGVRRIFPILAAYVADYPEQCLVTCSKYGTCPRCRRPAKELGEPTPGELRKKNWTLGVIQNAKDSNDKRTSFFKACMAEDVSGGVPEPFWKDFPYCDIHSCITPDVLHQLYQGVFKYIVDWTGTIFNKEELDACIRSLPPAFGTRHFKNGISCLAQISGSERKHMARILLACLAGRLARPVLVATRSILDFIYLAQYPTHSDTTLLYMQNALDTFLEHRYVFQELGLRDDFNIPKFHSLLHYIDSIKRYGTTDNYNTEMFERFHIDFAKEGWRASNKRDERPQMAQWLSRQEKVASFSAYLDSQQPMQDVQVESSAKGIRITKSPHQPHQLISSVEVMHDAAGLTRAIKEYINSLVDRRENVARHNLPFSQIDIYHNFRFTRDEVGYDEALPSSRGNTEVVHCKPSNEKHVARFDTVVVYDNSDEAESTGLEDCRNAYWAP
ncbi:hypothetical protein BV25DRAFT_1921995 [Artomyces pyxidatus]|uniref:Uncharacterized protein n=1 Tax=Artomyces pyxidatus TaxID=48021 RepID=A0ACB8SH78_9AGAM|nr:hypothetical protein BV25DRAFT_1921995 [Artomyces pyxidatus]